MKKEIKDMWTAALRSGEYKQGQHTLRTGDEKLCCLGVLSILHAKATGKGEWRRQGENGPWSYGTLAEHANGENRYGILPGSVLEWSGLELPDPEVASLNKTLAVINDESVPFPAIAEIIDKNF